MIVVRVAFLSVLIAVAAAAPASATLAYRRAGSSQIVVARNDGSAPRVIARGSFPVVSPDGRFLVFGTRRPSGAYDLWLIRTRGGRRRLVGHHVPIASGYPASNPHWSPDSRYLFFSDANTALSYFYDVRRHRRITIGFFVTGESFAPDSAHAVLEESDPKSSWLVTFAIPGGQGMRLSGGMNPAWGAGGIAYERLAGIWLKPRVRSYGRLLVPQDGRSPLYPVGWSRDGRRLLVVAGVGEPPALQALVITPTRHRMTTLSPGFSDIDALSRNGKRVLGVVNGNVVAVGLDGSVRVLAQAADEPSWNE
jgi:Tol biopolymer transport system component